MVPNGKVSALSPFRRSPCVVPDVCYSTLCLSVCTHRFTPTSVADTSKMTTFETRYSCSNDVPLGCTCPWTPPLLCGFHMALLLRSAAQVQGAGVGLLGWQSPIVCLYSPAAREFEETRPGHFSASILLLGRLRQENRLNSGGGGCSERSHHCSPAWGQSVAPGPTVLGIAVVERTRLRLPLRAPGFAGSGGCASLPACPSRAVAPPSLALASGTPRSSPVPRPHRSPRGERASELSQARFAKGTSLDNSDAGSTRGVFPSFSFTACAGHVRHLQGSSAACGRPAPRARAPPAALFLRVFSRASDSLRAHGPKPLPNPQPTPFSRAPGPSSSSVGIAPWLSSSPLFFSFLFFLRRSLALWPRLE
ncbi:uncharacterized protein [Macaca nemestrina]|uniref:uncharacterized protein n=1 Tax=Macaca nemestrina TaxID=9545 RepID=UPI0039B8B4C1